MSKLSLIDTPPQQPNLATMDEEQGRAYLETIHTPKLDELRQTIKAMRTSQLIAAITNASLLIDVIDPSDPSELHQVILAAAMVCVVDEFDRRVPIPKG